MTQHPDAPSLLRRHPAAGFTIVELVVAITLMGIIAAVIGTFIGRPVEAYIATQRRGDLTATADFALRRMSRDIKLALPLSLRTTCVGTCSDETNSIWYIEFLQTKAGGRFAYNPACYSGTGCNSITTLGNVNDGSWTFNANSDRLVLFSQFNKPTCPADLSAWCGNTYAPRITAFGSGGTSQTISFAQTNFSAAADQPPYRFKVVDGPVTFVCNPVNGTLTRYSGYALQDNPQPTDLTAAPLNAATRGLLAANVSACRVDYDGNPSAQFGLQGRGLMSLRLDLTRNSETVSLYHQIAINNVP